MSKFAIQCLKNKKYVFLEKPGSLDSKGLKRIKASITSENCCYINYQYCLLDNFDNLRVKKLNEYIQLDFNWKKWGSFGNDIKRNLLSHDLYIAKHLIPGFTLKNNISKFYYSEDIIHIVAKDKNYKVYFHIDRTSKNIKEKTIKRLDTNYELNLYNQKDSNMIINKQIDFFLKNLTSHNIDICISILEDIEYLEELI